MFQKYPEVFVYLTFPQSFLLHAKSHRHRAPVSLKKFNATKP